MHEVGFEPTSTNTVELESTPLDHSGIHAFTFLSIFEIFTNLHCMEWGLNPRVRIQSILSRPP